MEDLPAIFDVWFDNKCVRFHHGLLYQEKDWQWVIFLTIGVLHSPPLRFVSYDEIMCLICESVGVALSEEYKPGD